jgi:SAM-dependent methyltransferase
VRSRAVGQYGADVSLELSVTGTSQQTQLALDFERSSCVLDFFPEGFRTLAQRANPRERYPWIPCVSQTRCRVQQQNPRSAGPLRRLGASACGGSTQRCGIPVLSENPAPATHASVCVVCRGAPRPWADVLGYHIDVCASCGHGQVNPRPSAQELTEYYETGGGHLGQAAPSLDDILDRERWFPNSTVDAKRMVSVIVGLAPERGRLLDVGCGYGFFTKRALEAGFSVEALEIAPVERSCARTYAQISPLDVSFEDYAVEDACYDAILMSQVLEHAADVNGWMRKAHRILRPGGTITVAVPNFGGLLRRLLGRRDRYISPPAHLNYFTPRSLATLLKMHGFELVRLDTVSRIPYDALSKRLAFAPFLSAPTRYLLSHGQRAPLGILDRAHLGMFLQAYGRRLK